MADRPDPQREVPDGFELVAEPDPDWRLVTGKRCRSGAGYHHSACGQPSVAELNRSTGATAALVRLLREAPLRPVD